MYSKRSLAILFSLGVVSGGWMASQLYQGASKSDESQQVCAEERELMGTRWIIQVASTNRMDDRTVRTHINAAFEEVARVESVMSEWRPDSPISAVNAAAGSDPVPVPDELRELILRAREISILSEGAFDITWKGLGNLWRLGDDDFSPPSESEIGEARARVNYRKIIVDQNRVGLKERGMQIGLGGIAKGYGVDRASRMLHAAGLNNYYIDGGGDIAVAGLKHGRPWRVAIRHPRKGAAEFLTMVELSDAAIVTSGDYERFRVSNGRRYHHIVDPRTGEPAVGCQSVTVVAPLAELADALATAAFVLGPEDGLNLIARLPNAEALIVDAHGRWRMTDQFKAMAQLIP